MKSRLLLACLLGTQKYHSYLKGNKRVYSGTEYESPWPENTDLGHPKFCFPVW